MTEHELELWNRISAFEFDQPTATFTFAMRLAKDNGFAREFAAEVIEEYRKFIFLCCVSPGQMAPSHFVDQAWHLHLTYTRSYWIDLCKNTIDRELHHNPTQGGEAEDKKYRGLYKDTLALYKRYFRSEPPRTIWPDDNQPPEKRTVEVDRGRNWIVRKPELGLPRRAPALAVAAIILSTLFVGCTSYAGGIAVGLGMGWGVALGVGIFAAIVYWLVKRRNDRGGDSSGCGSGGCGSGGSHIYGSDAADSHGGSSEGLGSSDASEGGDSGGGDSGCGGGGCGGGGD